MGIGNICNDINKGLFDIAIIEINNIKLKQSYSVYINACDELIKLCNKNGDTVIREILIDYICTADFIK